MINRNSYPDENNTIPDGVRRIHLVAICGTGMGALACMLKDLGFDVVGSDQKVYPPMSDFLRSRGIPIHDGFDGSNLSPRPDLVVIGNAVSITNPEAAAMLELGLPYCSMPQAINHFVGAGKKSILVTGTHGKTTTSAMIAWILQECGYDPSFFIGGILNNFGSNYRLGRGDHLVIEGDEYDTAFFDKGPKFMHYDPLLTVLTSVEFDHADIFSDLDHIKQVFDRFLSGLSPESTLFAFDANENVGQLIKNRSYPVRCYGREPASDWRLGPVTIQPPWTLFDVLKDQKTYGTFRTRMVGEHNLFNALSAIGVGDALGIPPESIAGALASFEGIKRRQEIRGQKKGITVMDDFAHHPTAVRETLKAVGPFYPEGRLIAVFEPRTNSSMRDVFQSIYPSSFDSADIICIRKPPLLEKIPSHERFSSEKLVDDLKKAGKAAYYFSDTRSIIEFLVQSSRSGDLVLIMSNGGFDNIHERLLSALEGSRPETLSDIPFPWKFPGRESRIHYFGDVPSTMDVARELARKGCPGMTVVIAGRQTKGRGRLKRTWLSAEGGLYFNMVLRPDIPPALSYRINFIASLVLSQVLEGLHGIPARVKWPNDVLVDGMKISGILAEMEGDSKKVEFINIGIGINVNNDPAPVELKATSVKSLLQRPVSRRELLAEFLDAFEKRMDRIISDDVMPEWKARTITVGKKVRIVTTQEESEGVAIDITDTGALLLQQADGSVKTVVYGDCFLV